MRMTLPDYLKNRISYGRVASYFIFQNEWQQSSGNHLIWGMILSSILECKFCIRKLYHWSSLYTLLDFWKYTCFQRDVFTFMLSYRFGVKSGNSSELSSRPSGPNSNKKILLSSFFNLFPFTMYRSMANILLDLCPLMPVNTQRRPIQDLWLHFSRPTLPALLWLRFRTT